MDNGERNTHILCYLSPTGMDSYGGVEGPPHIFFDIMLSHTDDIVTRP